MGERRSRNRNNTRMGKRMIKEKSEEEEKIEKLVCRIYRISFKDFTIPLFKSLNTKLKLVDRDTEEFLNIDEYVHNTHGKTHRFNLEVINIYATFRKDENKYRYTSRRGHGNRRMLWHGTKMENLPSILQKGLVTPEEGYTGNEKNMFGNGVYFADCVTKAAQYCEVTDKRNPYGILILAEVALGNVYYKTKGENITELPRGKNSCKGLGLYTPAHAHPTIRSKRGIVMPLGPLVQRSKFKSDLKYNEYIVYQESRIIIEYLVEVKFNFL